MAVQLRREDENDVQTPIRGTPDAPFRCQRFLNSFNTGPGCQRDPGRLPAFRRIWTHERIQERKSWR